MASRVPLLVKTKARKPSRGSIAPRAKPSNAPRASRPATIERNNSQDADVLQPKEAADKLFVTQEKNPMSSTQKSAGSVDPPSRGVMVKGSTVSDSTSSEVNPTVLVTNAARATGIVNRASFSSQDQSTGTITQNGKHLTTSPSGLKSPETRFMPLVRSPIVLPGKQCPERLAKITSAGPLYRASPVVRPRAGSLGSSPGIRPYGTNMGSSSGVRLNGPNSSSSPILGPQDAMKQRMVRKLDIKPHQSPRRLQRLRHQPHSASPLLLGGKSSLDLSKQLPDIQLANQSTVARKAPRKKAATQQHVVSAKRQKTQEATTSHPSDRPPRRSSRRRTTRSRYRETDDTSSSTSEPEDERDDDSNDLDLPADETNIYVPARERATLWAKSLLQDNVKIQEKAKKSRKRCSNSNVSLVSTIVTGIGSGIVSRSKLEELLKKEPSQMTMGELALTVPKGRRRKLHEREESIVDTLDGTGESASQLLNMNALNRVRTLSMSSEPVAFAGSFVTPQVQIIDGQMVVVENTITLGDDLALCEESIGESTRLPPRHPSWRNSTSHLHGPGRRWSKEETKQFYYCLSQVGPNFSMMATLFPTRKRKELKSKFKYEEKHHANLIEIALRASAAPLDTDMVDVISQMVDKEAQQKVNKRRPRKDDDTASVASSKASSLMSATPQVEFLETKDDDDFFRLNRCGSFDFSG